MWLSAFERRMHTSRARTNTLNWPLLTRDSTMARPILPVPPATATTADMMLVLGSCCDPGGVWSLVSTLRNVDDGRVVVRRGNLGVMFANSHWDSCAFRHCTLQGVQSVYIIPFRQACRGLSDCLLLQMTIGVLDCNGCLLLRSTSMRTMYCSETPESLFYLHVCVHYACMID